MSHTLKERQESVLPSREERRQFCVQPLAPNWRDLEVVRVRLQPVSGSGIGGRVRAECRTKIYKKTKYKTFSKSTIIAQFFAVLMQT